MAEKEIARLRNAFNIVAEHIKSCPAHPLAKALAELAQIRTELKDLQGANREYRRQVETITSNREYWYRAALKAESERDAGRQAESALANCGIGGIYSRFNEPTFEVVTREKELTRMLQTERQLRDELDRMNERVEEAEERDGASRRELAAVHLTLSECGVKRNHNDGKPASAITRVYWLNGNEASGNLQRAETLTATLTEVYAMLSCSPEHPWRGCEEQTVVNEAHYYSHAREARELLEEVLA